jgi:hypothetical protein
MRKTVRHGIACAALAIALVAVPGLRAQDRKESLPAPLPAQIFTAKKVFVSNGGGDTNDYYSGGPDRAYNQLYAALKSLGRYELVTAPADVELAFEISFSVPIVGEFVSAGGGTMVTSKTVIDPQFRLAIRDLKTHILLWTFTEHVQNALLQGHRDKNFDLAMAALVNDIRNVAGQPAPAGTGPSK